MCMLYFSVKFYTDGCNTSKENGYVCGDSYAAAARNLSDCYGENDIISITIKYVADRPLVILPSEEAITSKGLIKAIYENNNI